jgi:hypothetical protein
MKGSQSAGKILRIIKIETSSVLFVPKGNLGGTMAENKRFSNPKQIAIGWYLAGFADGEGSFYVTFRQRADYTLGWRITPVFNVSNKDIVILALFKKTLGCGTIREIGNGKFFYEVEKLESLEESVLPFFQKFRFFSAKKKKEFATFKKLIGCCKKKPRGMEELKEILQYRKLLGETRERRYKRSDDEILKYATERKKSSETIR